MPTLKKRDDKAPLANGGGRFLLVHARDRLGALLLSLDSSLGGNRYCGEILLSNTLSTHETVTYSARMACPLALRCYYIT